MNNTLAAIITAAAVTGVCAGCSDSKPQSVPQQSSEKPAAVSPPQRSAAKDVVYTMTQYDSISAGRAAQEKVKKAAAQHNRDLDDASDGQ